ncbi:hypothetical protein ACFFJY_12925 [Fictibacillus aquaticus]|uniref:WYL domain-containing protein n=1 Tax=Fictibacillus aquaticus TaxID=2021314 RepID=A0A235FDW9_9BACL|nr:hypothetical protein [Fictibacillus aquaticus]OYD59134.1 hypothetical protein CGZ90_04345 [Fictibacillus aquaticus]
MKEVLNRCLRGKMPFEMIYLSKEGFLTQRKVSPISFNETVFSAYCFHRRQVRTFYIENVLSAAYQLPPS